jgi:hypothetical protein
MPGERVTDEPPQFLVRDLHERRPGR